MRRDDCIVIHVPFSLRGIGKQGFQCQGKDKLSVTTFLKSFIYFLIFSDNLFFILWFIFWGLLFFVSSSLQFCGPQKMSRVCDLYLSWLGDRPKTRCEWMCHRIPFYFEFLLHFPLQSLVHPVVIIIIFSHAPITRDPLIHPSVRTSLGSCSLVLPATSPLMSCHPTRFQRCSKCKIESRGDTGGGWEGLIRGRIRGGKREHQTPQSASM